MPNLYVRAAPTTDLSRNTEWFTYPGVWTIYILILFFSWLVVLSVFDCSPGMAWTIVHLSNSVINAFTFADDLVIYNRLTWWEQIENGKQLTPNRKFFTVFPVVLYGTVKRFILVLHGAKYTHTKVRYIFYHMRYLIASHTKDYQHPVLFFNTLATFILVVAKFPHMHKARIFEINADQ